MTVVPSREDREDPRNPHRQWMAGDASLRFAARAARDSLIAAASTPFPCPAALLQRKWPLMTVALTAATALVAVLLSYVLWVKTRRRQLEITLDGRLGITAAADSLAALTWSRVIEGNAVEVIQDAAFFDALLDDVASATHHIHLETFLWRDGSVSDRVASALSVAAARGLEVRVLVDQRGAKQTTPSVWARMRSSGCDFRVHHRARFSEFAWYNHRDHRKIAVIDGETAYTFGHGIADMWRATPEKPKAWRDTAARLRGPAVTEFQTAFFDNWIRASGVAPVGPRYFRRLAPAGDSIVHVAYLSAPETPSAVQRLYFLAIAAAREEIILQNPYFLPGPHALRLFRHAAERGVVIRIMLPTSETSDFPIVQHASHHFYGHLLRMGAKVYEYTRSGLHQKVMVIDREWCSIGSTNFDRRSFRINDEITLGIADPRIATDLATTFEADLAGAEEWTLERWNARTSRHRVVDWVSSLARKQL